jgi:hypothetical protein
MKWYLPLLSPALVPAPLQAQQLVPEGPEPLTLPPVQLPATRNSRWIMLKNCSWKLGIKFEMQVP